MGNSKRRQDHQPVTCALELLFPPPQGVVPVQQGKPVTSWEPWAHAQLAPRANIKRARQQGGAPHVQRDNSLQVMEIPIAVIAVFAVPGHISPMRVKSRAYRAQMANMQLEQEILSACRAPRASTATSARARTIRTVRSAVQAQQARR